MNVRFAFSHNFGTGLNLYDSLSRILHFNVAFLKYTLKIIHYTVAEFLSANKISHRRANVVFCPPNHSGTCNFSKYGYVEVKSISID